MRDTETLWVIIPSSPSLGLIAGRISSGEYVIPPFSPSEPPHPHFLCPPSSSLLYPLHLLYSSPSLSSIPSPSSISFPLLYSPSPPPSPHPPLPLPFHYPYLLLPVPLLFLLPLLYPSSPLFLPLFCPPLFSIPPSSFPSISSSPSPFSISLIIR